MSVNKVLINCPNCKLDFVRNKKQIDYFKRHEKEWKCKTCTLVLRNKSSAKENGSTRVHNKKGYILEKTNNGWFLQHHIVIEKHLGRKLNKDEAVHHINGIKTDNYVDNLLVMNHGEHTRLHNLERAKYVNK